MIREIRGCRKQREKLRCVKNPTPTGPENVHFSRREFIRNNALAHKSSKVIFQQDHRTSFKESGTDDQPQPSNAGGLSSHVHQRRDPGRNCCCRLSTYYLDVGLRTASDNSRSEVDIQTVLKRLKFPNVRLYKSTFWEDIVEYFVHLDQEETC